jgi:hypothetical protein
LPKTIPTQAQLDLIAPGVYDIPIRLEPELEPNRQELRRCLVNAQERLHDFAIKYDWEQFTLEPFASSAGFFAHKGAFDQALLETCGLDPATKIPETYCAALEQGSILCVSPELYRRLYPAGDEPNAFEKLLAHEMAHRLHIRILGGDEEAMGPVWFYEGFALFAAGQMEKNSPLLTAEELQAVVEAEERQDYRRYVTAFRTFLGSASLQQLIGMAGKPDFRIWLKQISA